MGWGSLALYRSNIPEKQWFLSDPPIQSAGFLLNLILPTAALQDGEPSIRCASALKVQLCQLQFTVPTGSRARLAHLVNYNTPLVVC